MKRLIQFFMLCFFIMISFTELKAQEPKKDLVTVCYKSSMDCHSCETELNNYLKFEKGVKDLKVDLKSNTIKVVYKSGKNTSENLAKGIREKGYEAIPITESEYKVLTGENLQK